MIDTKSMTDAELVHHKMMRVEFDIPLQRVQIADAQRTLDRWTLEVALIQAETNQRNRLKTQPRGAQS